MYLGHRNRLRFEQARDSNSKRGLDNNSLWESKLKERMREILPVVNVSKLSTNLSIQKPTTES